MSAMVTVLYFGAAEEVAGTTSETLSADDTATLCSQILEKYPSMRSISFRLALNSFMLTEETALNDNDIIAILPPFKGG